MSNSNLFQEGRIKLELLLSLEMIPFQTKVSTFNFLVYTKLNDADRGLLHHKVESKCNLGTYISSRICFIVKQVYIINSAEII